jgi:hypothetical protein
MKTLKFSSNAPTDRREAFEYLCKANNLDVVKEAEKHGIDNPKAGYNVTIEKLFLFLYKNKMVGSFDFEAKEIKVQFEEKPSIGKTAINKPETIKDSKVDEVDIPEDDDEDPELPF